MSDRKNENLYKFIGMLIPIIIAAVLILNEWGAIKTKISVFETHISKLFTSMEKQAEILTQLREDVAYIKGKLK